MFDLPRKLEIIVPMVYSMLNQSKQVDVNSDVRSELLIVIIVTLNNTANTHIGMMIKINNFD